MGSYETDADIRAEEEEYRDDAVALLDRIRDAAARHDRGRGGCCCELCLILREHDTVDRRVSQPEMLDGQGFLPVSGQCCCAWGSAVSGEFPEFPCARCPRHGEHGMGAPDEMCRRHRKAAGL